MNEHPAPPRRRIVLLRTTTTDILKKTASIFSTRNNLHMFLLLSFMLFFHRLIAEQATRSLTSFIDSEPSIKSYFSQIHKPPNSTSITTTITTRRRLPHRVGTLDDDLDHGFFGNLPKPQSNSTSLILDSFRASEIARSSAKTTFRLTDIIENEENAVADEINDSQPIKETAENNSDSHDFTAVLYLIGSFFASYIVIYLVLVTQSIVHGVIFVLVLNDFCKRYNLSFVTTCLNGCCLGYIRSFGFMVIRWLVRYAFTVFFGSWFFAEIEDRHSALKIFVRLLFFPFSIFTHWDKEFEKEIVSFIVTWLILNFLLSFALTVDVWVVMDDSREINDREVVKEGFHLLSLMIIPAFILKSYEGLVCGPYVRWLIAQTFGDLFAMALQAFMEVYFMVAWMVYYLSVKSIDANLRGQPFGQPELEAMIVDRR